MIRWRTALDSAAWRRVLVVAPHPDDETLATGGLLQRSVALGGAVRVVFVTDGENNPWPQRVLERRWRLDSAARARWGVRRREETLHALACLGIPASSALFLHRPDQGITSLLLAGDGDLVSALAAELKTWRPTLVVAPSVADRHPDHNALAVLLRLAVDRVATRQGGFTELAYLVHGAAFAPALDLRLAPAERARKREAILCHGSQLALSWGRFLSHARETERFVDPAAPSPAHRVRGATFASGMVSLRLAQPVSLAAALPATLDVLTVDAPGCPVHWRSCTVAPWRREVELPIDRVPARLLVKCEPPHVFFDDAGWRELRLEGEAEMVPVPLSSNRAAGADA